MAELQEFEVKLSDGRRGKVLRTSRFLDKREFNTVKLSNGTELTVPAAALEPQQDGSFYLRERGNSGAQGADRSRAPATQNVTESDGSRAPAAQSLPNAEGPNTPEAQTVTQSSSSVDASRFMDASLFKEDVDVQRVPINRVLDAPVEMRVEDGVTIIPVMEERVKVEKQLILREEIRIVKKRTSVQDARLISPGENRENASSQNQSKR